MKPFTRLIQCFTAISLATFCLTANAQTVPEPATEPATTQQPKTAEASNNNTYTFPVPTAEDGAELLRYENITFAANDTPLDDAAEIMQAAKKGDVSSQFIAHMMYRDNIGDIAIFNDGKKIDRTLTPIEMHREMIRWRDIAFEANYELALLAMKTNPKSIPLT